MGHPIPILNREPVRLVTFYWAQAYWRDRAKLARGKFKQFKSERDALATGEKWARRHIGVAVFVVSGNPEADYWQEPRVVARFGETPV